MRNLIFSSKTTNFIKRILYSFINIDYKFIVDFCGFTCFEPKIVFVMILRTIFGLQQVKIIKQLFVRFHLLEKSCKVKSNFGTQSWITTIATALLMEILFRAMTVIWLCSLPLVSNLWKLFELFDHIANFWKIDWHEKLVKWHQTKLWYKELMNF